MAGWTSLAFNGLWVLGAAVIVATISLSTYEARHRGERLGVRLTTPSFRLWLLVGLVLISLGAALAASHWWGHALWGMLCAATAWQLWATWRVWKTQGDKVLPP